ncbi:hypothetical protein [Agriterribacter sp.]|uniref:hypothetical protein n=1 Tax=Agriterribacter sp. TaxID=2821509 RepID=UPI002C45BB24|nr:hypothetical protein [Agriterribacter sp.]HRO44569.1 hypothetical protein [Agriterribacter sp.]HRQ16006.1 hypothetical protein [Agriterribacter sp.]
MKRLAIIHFLPLEFYPPVINFINYISHKKLSFEVDVYSTALSLTDNFFVNESVNIHRFRMPDKHKGKLQRMLEYFKFYASVFLHLLKNKPTDVLYYETLSFLPVYAYKISMRFLGKSPRIFCHFHEYITPLEYKTGMILNRVIHTLEKKQYARMDWISHTNEDRMQFFKKDNPGIKFHNTYILPNYPPASWLNPNRQNKNTLPVRIVYAGALGMDTMYIKEFAKWVESKNGTVMWDIYSLQDAGPLLAYLSSIGSRFIHFKGQVNYYDLPGVLEVYQVGVILYKGHIPNYIYNAPNKLFEYYACGLDTWFPVEMKTSHAYVTNNSYPRIVAVDFQNMEEFDLAQMIDHSNLTYQNSPYFYEKVLDPLWRKLSMT